MRLLSFVFFTFLCFSCSEKPKVLTIPQDRMIDMLVDIHLAESALQNYYNEEKDSLALLYYKQIYRMHDIDEKLLNENLEVLRKEPKLLNKLYDKVVEQLNEEEANAVKQNTNRKQKLK